MSDSSARGKRRNGPTNGHAAALRPSTGTDGALWGNGSDSVARFRYDALTGSWWWSDQLLAVHGYQPGEVVASLPLLLSHAHPEDRETVQAVFEGALADGSAFSSRHRLVDTAQTVRQVVAMGEGVRANGTLIALRGYLIDVTESLRQVVQRETAEGIARSNATRAAIEQAKGALMATYGITEDEAFEALRAYSNHANVKLNSLAAYLVGQLVNPALAHLRTQDKLGEILAVVTESPGLLVPPAAMLEAVGDGPTESQGAST
jgi:ANTAR domain/PAS fold